MLTSPAVVSSCLPSAAMLDECGVREREKRTTGGSWDVGERACATCGHSGGQKFMVWNYPNSTVRVTGAQVLLP